MKYKNYKSAIHNFSHSFMSIDYTKSGRLAVNVIINLYKIGKENKATFDFIKKEIIPKEAETEGSKQLLKDYLNWLPEHFKKHDCDFTKLEKLEVTIWTDFNKALIPFRMNKTKQFELYTLTKWKADGRDEQIIKIFQTELINEYYLNTGIPEL